MAPFNPNSATQSDLEIFRSPSSLYLLLTFDSRTSIATHSNQSVLFLLCVCAILCRRVVTKQLKARHSGKHIFASITRLRRDSSGRKGSPQGRHSPFCHSRVVPSSLDC
ncbi:hypothetical protein OUZ56_006812 [Daphnia magna]|uniref:Uncharacterized protein n=1 Tax=Daphnia magna TaxID=35525 RepID=A0ABQ9YX76_9CRUS|nr:hypothetical protein OUZ56_006812 [Daphnia magna]